MGCDILKNVMRSTYPHCPVVAASDGPFGVPRKAAESNRFRMPDEIGDLLSFQIGNLQPT